MIGRQRPPRRRHPRAAQVRQLFRVQLDRQLQPPRLVEDALHLGHRKGDPLAEPVHRVDQPLFRRGAQGRQADLGQIVARPALELRRHRMGAQKAGLHPDRPHLGDPPRGAQHGQLGLDIQTIARLDLDRCHAFADQRIDPRQRRRQQPVLARLARVAHRRQDPAPGARDFFVTRALQAQLELARPVAAMDQMGVAVDQRRRDQPAADIHFLAPAQVGGHRIARPRPDDPARLDRDGAIRRQAVTLSRQGRQICIEK